MYLHNITNSSKMIVIFTFFLLLNSYLFGQINGKKIAVYEIDNIKFHVESMDFKYEFGDTVDILYRVINNSNNDIYIFDPTQYYSLANVQPKYDSDNCQYLYKLGGSWLHKLGYVLNLKLIHLEFSSEFVHTFKLILKPLHKNNSCNYGVAPWRENEDLLTYFTLFDIGFIPITDSLKIKTADEKGYMDFETIENTIFFEGHLRRFYLGPLWFQIKK